MEKFVAYYRVSTGHQFKNNQSLGIESQRAAVRLFIGNNQGVLVDEVIEMESGKNNDRPLLEKAIQTAAKNSCTLIIAKLDRLSREVSFLFQLKQRAELLGIKIKSLDIPELNTLNLGIFGTIAQYERELISTRTKVALAELKKQGIKLGSPQNLTDEVIKKAHESNRQKAAANQNNRQATAIITQQRENGMSYIKIAAYLNQLNFSTRYGKSFTSTGVKRLADRAIN